VNGGRKRILGPFFEIAIGPTYFSKFLGKGAIQEESPFFGCPILDKWGFPYFRRPAGTCSSTRVHKFWKRRESLAVWGFHPFEKFGGAFKKGILHKALTPQGEPSGGLQHVSNTTIAFWRDGPSKKPGGFPKRGSPGASHPACSLCERTADYYPHHTVGRIF